MMRLRAALVRKWPLKKLARHKNRRPSPDLSQYESGYEATLGATLNLIECGFESAILPQLSPVYLDPSEQGAGDIPGVTLDHVYRDDLQSFVETQRQTRRMGAWTGFAELMTIQPRLCLRISRRVHEFAIRHAPIVRHDEAPALPIGPSSVYILIILNNLLCLHHRIETTPEEDPTFFRSLFMRYETHHTAMKGEINLGFKKMQDSMRETGDMIFLHSVMGFVTSLREHDHLVAYLNRLICTSPMTIATDMINSAIWEQVGDTELSGIERLMDTGSPFSFSSLFVQHWVDALLTTRGEVQRQVYRRIEGILDYMFSGLPPSTSSFTPHEESCRRCLVQLVRMLIRIWPDEQRQDEVFGESPEQSEVWYDILTCLLRRIEDINLSMKYREPESSLSASDYQMLHHSIVLAQRSMARAAS